MECHIQGDYLLIWLDEKNDVIELVRLAVEIFRPQITFNQSTLFTSSILHQSLLCNNHCRGNRCGNP